MLNRLAKLREEREDGDRGFTLIELLVVVVIIGILIAIAIPLYLHFQNGAKNSSAESDVRNAANVVKQCEADNGSLPDSVEAGTAGDNVTICDGEDATVSDGNTLAYTNNDDGTFTIVGTSSTNKTYTFESSTGKISVGTATTGSN